MGYGLKSYWSGILISQFFFNLKNRKTDVGLCSGSNFIFKVYSWIFLKFCMSILWHIPSDRYFSFFDIFQMAAVLDEKRAFIVFYFFEHLLLRDYWMESFEIFFKQQWGMI